MPIFISILVVIIIVVILLDRFIARMYRNPKKSHQATPVQYNIAFKEVRIPHSKRSQLYGWWISASPSAPTIILVHGWGRNLSRMLQYIVHLYPLGYNLLAFDARNHGSSSSEKHQPSGHFRGYPRCHQFYRQIRSGSSSDFGIIGLSIGGGAAINAASSDLNE